MLKCAETVSSQLIAQGGALMVAFPAISRWLAGESLESERESTLRADVVTFALHNCDVCCVFRRWRRDMSRTKSGGAVDSLFGSCVTTSELR